MSLNLVGLGSCGVARGELVNNLASTPCDSRVRGNYAIGSQAETAVFQRKFNHD